jgi:hypothetical protein
LLDGIVENWPISKTTFHFVGDLWAGENEDREHYSEKQSSCRRRLKANFRTKKEGGLGEPTLFFATMIER